MTGPHFDGRSAFGAANAIARQATVKTIAALRLTEPVCIEPKSLRGTRY